MNEKIKKDNLTRRDFVKNTAVGGAVLVSGFIGFPSIIEAKTPMRVGYIPLVDHLAMLISHDHDNEGFQNVAITPQRFGSLDSVVEALEAGELEGAFLPAPLAMKIYNKGTKIKAVLVGHRNGSGITVVSDSSIFSAADLKGKNIAIPAQISPHTALLDHYLRGAGLTINDVNTMVTAPPNMIVSMIQGMVDAFIVSDPFVSLAEAMGVGKTMVLSKTIMPNHICCVVVVREEVIAKNPEAISEWVASIQKSGAFIDQDKAENGGKDTAEIAAKYTPHNPDVIANALVNPHDRIMFNNLQPRLEDFEAILKMSQAAGILPEIALNGFITDQFATAG